MRESILRIMRGCSMQRFIVAQPEAVEELFDKLRIRARDDPKPWQRLVTATDRAHARYLQVGSPVARGFYHGLLTGYAVALEALQGTMTGTGRTSRWAYEQYPGPDSPAPEAHPGSHRFLPRRRTGAAVGDEFERRVRRGAGDPERSGRQSSRDRRFADRIRRDASGRGAHRPPARGDEN